jgi:hypothetical protein
VFWAGSFQPAFMVDPKLDYVVQQDPSHALELRANFVLADYPDADTLAAALQGASLEVLDVTRMSDAWTARMSARAMDAYTLAMMPGCLWVERFVPFELDNNVARTSEDVPTGRGASSGPIMDVERVWDMGIRGEGQIASASDTGLSQGDLTTPNNFHYDFGQTGSATNPMRVIHGYALNDRGTWDDDQDIGGGHGTHTSGSIVGNGFRSGSTPSTDTFPTTCFAGTAPKAEFVFQSVMTSDGNLGGIPADLTTLFQTPYDDGARVHSNSWGAPMAGAYTTDSQGVDKFVWTHPDMVITYSAGNSGVDCWYYNGSCVHPGGCSPDGVIDTDSIGSPGTAKDCITVGASEDYRPDFEYGYTDQSDQEVCESDPTWGWFNGCDFSEDPVLSDLMADNANGMAAFSSRGPCDDGRVKPDVVAPGTAVISTRTDVNQSYEQWGTCNVPSSPTDLRPYYVAMGGTSMANPLTAGSAVLVRQYYVDGWHANDSSITNASASAGDGFDPSAALVKATLINGAWDMAPGQYGTGATQEIPAGWDAPNDLPNNVEGYGRVDLYHSLFPSLGYGADAGRKMEVHDDQVGLATGDTAGYTFSVSSDANPLIVTLVWSDPYAATGAGTKLVNDLDLEVTSPGAVRYYSNRKDWTGGSRDAVNNVEQVYVTSPSSGTWAITVRGYNVPGNGQSGTTTQPYALVISGVGCTMAAPSSASAVANGDNHIDVSWASVGGAVEYHVYRSLTSGGGYGQIGTVTAPTTSYPDTGVSGGVPYYYVVRAVGSGLDACESGNSPEATATTTGSCTLPPAFAGLASVTAPVSDTCTLELSWSAATRQCGGAGSVTYSVYRSTSSGFTPSPANRIATGLTGTSYSDSGGVVYGTAYYYVVRATDTGTGTEDTNTVQRMGTPVGSTLVTAVLFSDTFESGSGLNGWETGWFSPATNADDWRGIQACAPAHGGSNVFHFGGATCLTDYGNSDNTFAAPGGESGITIPADATNVRLSFWHRRDFESGHDGAIMRVSLDNYNFYYFATSTGIYLQGGYNGTIYYPTTQSTTTRDAWTGTDTNFTNTVIDLDAACDLITQGSTGAAGLTLWIAFGGVTNASTTGLGWFLDDVTVTADVPGSCTTSCDPVTVSNLTVTTTETYTACGTLTLGPAFRVAAPGDVTVRAAVRVVLTNGFSVGPGATFHAGIDPSLAP